MNQIVNHVPLSAISNWALEQCLNCPGIKVISRGIEYLLQEKVRFFEFIVEEEVCLREFEFIKVVALHESNAEDVRRCEDPASARLPLVRDWSSLEWDLGIENLLVFDSCGTGC